MLFILGSLAILQITVLPGILFLRIINFQGSSLRRIVYTFALSLILNYCIVLMLVSIRLYIQPVVLVFAAGEIAAIIWLYKNELKTPSTLTLRNTWNSLAERIHEFFPTLSDNETGSKNQEQRSPLFWLVIVFSLAIIWPLVKVFFYNIGTVFNAWDAIVSWNHWAMIWASNQFPAETRLYPQLIPLNWSTTYVFMGGTTIQFFAKAIMPLFAVFILVLMFDLGLELRQIGFFIALFLTQLLLKKFVGPEITNGYVDVAVAFFGFLPIDALILARHTKDEQLRKQMLMLGAIFAAGAGVTKQAGLYIFAIYPLAVYFGLPKSESFPFKKFMTIFAIAAILPLVWYGLKGAMFALGIDSAETSSIIQVTQTAYKNAGYLSQLFSALTYFDAYIVLFLVILIALPFIDPLYRSLALLVIYPYPLVWAWVTGYDTRNLSIFLPIFTLVSGFALQKILEFLLQKLGKIKFFEVKNYVIWAVVTLALLASGFIFPSRFLTEKQEKLEIQNFSPPINEKLYAIIAKEGPNTKFLTNYPLRYLPGLDNNQIQCAFREYQEFLKFADNPTIKYMLVPGNALDPQVVEYLDKKIKSGAYKVLLVDKQWMKFTLIQVIRR